MLCFVEIIKSIVTRTFTDILLECNTLVILPTITEWITRYSLTLAYRLSNCLCYLLSITMVYDTKSWSVRSESVSLVE